MRDMPMWSWLCENIIDQKEESTDATVDGNYLAAIGHFAVHLGLRLARVLYIVGIIPFAVDLMRSYRAAQRGQLEESPYVPDFFAMGPHV